MQIGINQDIIFKNERFHIQTEDSGVKRAVISTILFKGGLVVSSSKASYQDKLDSEDIGKEVNALMQGLHKDMIRALKDGDFSKDKPAAEKAQGGRSLTVTEKALENKVLEFLSLK